MAQDSVGAILTRSNQPIRVISRARHHVSHGTGIAVGASRRSSVRSEYRRSSDRNFYGLYNGAPTGAEFLVALQNTSKADFVVNLGSMLGNGRVMFPAGVRARAQCSEACIRQNRNEGIGTPSRNSLDGIVGNRGYLSAKRSSLAAAFTWSLVVSRQE